MDILLNQLRQVVHLPIEADPAVISRAVLGHFLRSVVLSDFVWAGKVGGVLDARQL